MNSLIDLILKIFYNITKTEKTFIKQFFHYIMIFLGLYLIDSLTGFSYYQNITNKVEQTKQIDLILKDSCIIPNQELIQLKLLRKDVINHKSIKDNVCYLFSNMFFKTYKKPIITKPIKGKTIVQRNLLIHYITSSSSVLLIMIIFVFVGLLDGNSSLPVNIVVIVLMEVLLYPFTYLFSKALLLIPIINNQPMINYCINVFLSFAIPLSFWMFWRKGILKK